MVDQPRKKARAPNRSRAKQKQVRPPAIAGFVPDKYAGKTGVLMATGPSLSREDIEYIRPLHRSGRIVTFGLNDSYKWCDFLDVFYFCDPRWLASNPDAAQYTHGEIWTQDAGVLKTNPHIKRVAGGNGAGICKNPHKIHFGGNSGSQLIGLAYHFGIRDFVLLGYNMDVPPGTSQHMFGPHPAPLNQSNNYKGFGNWFNGISAQDRAMFTNCTVPSALTCFKKMPLRERLPDGKTRHIRIEEPAQETVVAVRPREEATEDIPVSTPDQAEMERVYGSADRDGTVPVSRPVEPDPIRTYGGPSEGANNQQRLSDISVDGCASLV